MVSAAANPEVSFTVQARDKATALFSKLEKSSVNLGTAWRSLLMGIRALNIGFLALAVTLPLVSAAIASVMTAVTTIGFLKFERASRRARFQLQLMGMTASQSRDQLATLTGLMDRAAVTSILQSGEAMLDVALAGSELMKQLGPLTDTLSDITGIAPDQMFIALFDAFAKHDSAKFRSLVFGMQELQIPIEILDQLEAGFAAPFLDFLHGITKTENVSRLEEVTKNLERISDISRPTREMIMTGSAATVNIFLESLATKLEAGEEELADIFRISLIAAASVAGSGVGRALGVGILVGLSLLLLKDIETTINDAFTNPIVTAGILATGLTAGKVLGGKKGGLVGGLIIVLGLELLPGLTEAFDTLERDQKFAIMGFGSGTLLGLAMKQGFLKSFAIGSIVQTAVDTTFSGGSLSDKAIVLSLATAGGIVGTIFGGPIGAAAGVAIGTGLGVWLRDADWRGFAREPAKQFGIAFANFFIDEINSAIRRMNEGWFGLGSILPDIPEMPKIISATPVDATAVIPPGAAGAVVAPPVTAVPVPTAEPVFKPLLTVPPEIPFPNMSVADLIALFGLAEAERIVALRGYENGGIVPGPLGAPQLATVHGGETILPRGGGIMVVQLVLDKQVIGEVAIDALHKTARYNAGMVPGSLGS